MNAGFVCLPEFKIDEQNKLYAVVPRLMGQDFLGALSSSSAKSEVTEIFLFLFSLPIHF